MSWLVTSITNSLKLDDEFGSPTTTTTADTNISTDVGDDQNPNSPSGGVKKDLSEISKTLTRQLWGVASFLAPPPQISDQEPQSGDVSDAEVDASDPDRIKGIRNDLSEIGGKFRNGISRVSGLASNLLHFGDLTVDDYVERGVVGVSEEVVAFAADVAMHPMTWLDFPLPHDGDIELEFDMSDTQQEHALAIERLAPELAALRTEICPDHMSEAYFWKIYFVLVHPILDKGDAEILSTPEIVRARAMLAQDNKNRGNSQPSKSITSSDATKMSDAKHESVSVSNQVEPIPVEVSTVEPPPSNEADIEMDKHSVASTDIPVMEKRVVEEDSIKQTNIEHTTHNVTKRVDPKDQDEDDDWLKDENTEGETVKAIPYSVENDEDISFSDLEDDDEVSTSDKAGGHIPKNKESNGWLDVEDIDDA